MTHEKLSQKKKKNKPTSLKENKSTNKLKFTILKQPCSKSTIQGYLLIILNVILTLQTMLNVIQELFGC